jgi:hypothetical protein
MTGCVEITMIRRLIKLDPATGDYSEIDEARLKRETRLLLEYIKKHIDPKTDEHGIWKWVVPLCQGVVDGTLILPMPFFTLPLKYAVREGLLPDDFFNLYAEFSLTISGTAREMLDNVNIDGNTYMYADFEDWLSTLLETK